MDRSDNEEIRNTEYLAEVVADELALAKLMGWANIEPPLAITPNCWIFATHLLARGHDHRNASVPCPRWRRSWEGAGELIARCELCMIVSGARVAVGAGPGNDFTAEAEFSDHPTKDDAIRYAMCKAAIAHLSAKPQ